MCTCILAKNVDPDNLYLTAINIILYMSSYLKKKKKLAIFSRLLIFKLHGYAAMFFSHFSEGDTFCEFLFASMGDGIVSKRIFSKGKNLLILE